MVSTMINFTLLSICISVAFTASPNSENISALMPKDDTYSENEIRADQDLINKRQCDQIEAIFNRSRHQACRCFDGVPDFDSLNLNNIDSPKNGNSSFAKNYSLNPMEHTDHRSLFGKIWIGCTKSDFPAINKELTSLPDDQSIVLSKLWIWDSMIALFIPTLFSKVKTEKLIFEHNRLYELSQARQALKTTSPYLRHLIFRNNVIKTTDAEFFRDLSNLRTLDLSYNMVESLDENSLGNGMSNLRYLSFENNRISALKGAVFAGLPNLESLNLASNRLVGFGDRLILTRLPNLRVLNLANNQLSSIPDWLFAQTPNLHVLNLANNSLRNLDGRIFDQLSNLKRLYLNSNFLTIVPTLKLSNLQVLTLDNNLINKFSTDWSKSLHSLKLLSMSSNRITQLLKSDFFKGLHSLSVLSMQNNTIEEIEDRAFGLFMPNLHKLLLSSNKLRKLSAKSFWGLEKLTILNLARNHLQDQSGDFLRDLKHLRRLHLNRNEFTALNLTFLNTLVPIKYVNLADNPWQCDCSALNLSIWIASHMDKVVDIENTICQLQDNSRISVADYYMSEIAKKVCARKFESIIQTGAKHGPSKIHKIEYGTSGSHSMWITVFAFVLATSSVLFLLAIVYMCVQDASKLKKNSLITQSVESNINICRMRNLSYSRISGYFMRRMPSDTLHLISKKSSPATAPLLLDRAVEK